MREGTVREGSPDVRRTRHAGGMPAAFSASGDHPTPSAPPSSSVPDPAWLTRPERPEDVSALREVLLAAFPSDEEADLVDALRRDPQAWIDGLSLTAWEVAGPTGADGPAPEPRRLVAQALLTRAHVGGEPVLALAPCATLPSHQRRGAGSAAIRAALEAARALGENVVAVLGHAEYYPRFGFTPASRFGVTAPFEAPDEAFLALALDPARPVPRGEIVYPPAFGV